MLPYTSENINAGLVCPYCQDETELVDSTEIYEKDYDQQMYFCRPCKAWVGCHRGTSKSTGRLANAELRKAKIEAHRYIDNLWKQKLHRHHNMRKWKARGKAYKWLAEQMGIDPRECHISMFDVEQCFEVIRICKPHYRHNFTAK